MHNYRIDPAAVSSRHLCTHAMHNYRIDPAAVSSRHLCTPGVAHTPRITEQYLTLSPGPHAR